MGDSRLGTYAHRDDVRALMVAMGTELIRRGHEHDASKLRDPERGAFDEIEGRLAGTTYGSPEYRATLDEYGWAIRQHYAANDHHPEHFAEGVAGMHLVQFLEMVADWIAASRRHDDGDVGRSLSVNVERFGMAEPGLLLRLMANTVEAFAPADAMRSWESGNWPGQAKRGAA